MVRFHRCPATVKQEIASQTAHLNTTTEITSSRQGGSFYEYYWHCFAANTRSSSWSRTGTFLLEKFRMNGNEKKEFETHMGNLSGTWEGARLKRKEYAKETIE